jgi:hypothetical protein
MDTGKGSGTITGSLFSCGIHFLNQLCLHKDKAVYNILFQSAWHVLNTFGHDHKWLGAQTGMIAILHTWGQTMTLHPHLHCIVPGGGLTRPKPMANIFFL